MRKLIQVTAFAAVVAATAVAPAAAMHGRGEGTRATKPSSAPRVTQRDLRLERLGPKYIESRPAASPVQVIRIVRTETFDWADAAVGAASAAAAVAFAAGAVLLARHRKPEVDSAPKGASI